MSRNRVFVFLLSTCLAAGAAIAAPQETASHGLTPEVVRGGDTSDPGRGPDSAVAQSISGRATNMQGAPISNARIDLTEGSTGKVVGSTYSGTNGQFSFAGVPAGNYELVAVKGLTEARERVNMEHFEAPGSVTLRLPMTDTSVADAGGKYTVTIAQMQVPDKARKALRQARKAMEAGKNSEANEYVSKALAIAPDFADALTLRGVLELDAKQPEKARDDMERAVHLDPTNGMSLIALGATYNVLQRHDDAMRVLRQGISLAPTAWQGYFELGKTYIGQGRYMDALTQLGRASDLAPKSFAPMHLVKAHVYLSLKNFEQSMYELQQYLQQEPNGPESAQVRSALQQVRAFAAVTPAK